MGRGVLFCAGKVRKRDVSLLVRETEKRATAVARGRGSRF